MFWPDVHITRIHFFNDDDDGGDDDDIYSNNHNNAIMGKQVICNLILLPFCDNLYLVKDENERPRLSKLSSCVVFRKDAKKCLTDNRTQLF